MKNIFLMVILVVSLFAKEEVKFYKPSFSCENVKKDSVEYKVCTDKELAKLDTILNNIYHSFRFVTQEIKQDQRNWLKKRNQCKDISCIKKAYTTRIEDLNISLSNEKTFPKYIIDAMKEAEEKMKIKWNPIIFDKQRLIDAGLKFKNELFHYKNIRFKPPLAENVKYDDPKLKKILGVCWYYRFDLEVKEFPNNPKYISDGKRYWVEDKRKPLSDINVSVWKTTSHDKEWLFIKPTSQGYAYLVDTAVCKQKRLKNTLVDALNYDRGRVKRSELGLDNSFIIMHKNQEYIFEASIYEWGIDFGILEILTFKYSNIYFPGISQALIPFEKIDKPQTPKGEK